MDPTRDNTLVEVLDRLLNKGAILNADLIITVAGIPMIGLTLRAALASMETMLEYGMMEDWDASTRNWYKNAYKKSVPLSPEENVVFEDFGYLYEDAGLISHWRPGIWYVTNRRMFLWRRDFEEILFELDLDDISGMESKPDDEHVTTVLFKGGSVDVKIRERLLFQESLLSACGMAIKV